MAISVPTFLSAELVGAAAIALWLLSAFPRLTPRSVRAVMVGCIGAFALLELLPLGVGAVVHLPNGAYAALFGCVLPVFVAVFLAIAWLMLLLAGAVGGSGGGGGHRVPVSSR